MYLQSDSDLQTVILKKLNEKFPDFQKEWDEFTNDFGIGLADNVRKIFRKQLASFDNIFTISISVVVDNNFVFSNIKGAVERGEQVEDSFIYKLCKCNIVQFYAPPKLTEELYEKIASKLSDNKDAATLYANTLLEYITIKDAQWVDEWKKANNLIGEVDEDDVPYLALAFCIGSHSIISYDKVFNKQGEIQVWSNKEIGKVVSSYNKGAASFVILGLTSILAVTLFKFLIFILKTIVGILIEIISLIIKIISGVSIAFLLSTLALLAVLYEDEGFKEFVEEISLAAKENIEEYKDKCVDGMNQIIKLITELKEFALPHLELSFDFLGFLLFQYSFINDCLKNIELKQGNSLLSNTKN